MNRSGSKFEKNWLLRYPAGSVIDRPEPSPRISCTNSGYSSMMSEKPS